MRALLTSSGIKNSSIHDALVDLLDKPIAESNALFIPTAVYPFPGRPGMAWRAICGKAPSPLCELGWKSLGVLELIPSSAHRRLRRDSFARGSAARVVSCRHTCPHPVHRYTGTDGS